MMVMGMEIFSMLLTVLFIMVGIAYVTLLERKVLGLIQLRYGPNKVGFVGLFQPFPDALKLLSKGGVNIMLSVPSMFSYMLMPIGMFLIMGSQWLLIPLVSSGLHLYSNNLLMMILLFSLSVYPIMYGGWFSGSYYSVLGSVRSVAQMISYEVSFIMVMVGSVVLYSSFNLMDYNDFMGLGLMVPLGVLLVYSMVIELNRSPSDLIEGESELVSGFNTEYWGLGFVLIFLGEYGMILFMGNLISMVIFGFLPWSIWYSMLSLIYIYLILMIRGVMPRMRYDQLMYMCWVGFLSSSLGFLYLVLGVSLLCSFTYGLL